MLSCCVMTTTVDFGEWLKKELNTRKMRAVDLAKTSGVDKTIISRALNGERMPKPDSLMAIARGLKVPPDVVFRAAGIFPPVKQSDPISDEITYLISLLPLVQKEVALRYMRFLVEDYQQRQDK